MAQTFLDLIKVCDNFRPSSATEELVAWRLSPAPLSPAIGLLRPVIVDLLKDENLRTGREIWCFSTRSGKRSVSFAADIATPLARTRVMQEMCERWRDEGLWSDVIGPKKWRSEMYPVYRDPFGTHDAPAAEEGLADDVSQDSRNYAFMMERAACALFGVVTYGVHMSIYQDALDGEGCMVWTPTRASTKQTWPGKLDNTVAGGIPSGLGVFECLVKEAMEEASIAEDAVRNHARAAGCVSYFYQTDAGWLQPEVEYIYDLSIPSNAEPTQFQPKPLDGEVASFELLTLPDITSHMLAGHFKPNCALVLVDFMVRRGHITPENEPNYLNIMTCLHGRFDYDEW